MSINFIIPMKETKETTTGIQKMKNIRKVSFINLKKQTKKANEIQDLTDGEHQQPDSSHENNERFVSTQKRQHNENNHKQSQKFLSLLRME